MKLRILAVFLFCAGLWCLSPAHGPVRAQVGCGGGELLMGVGGGCGGVGFQGAGDIVAGATAWWGLRAYSAAKRGTKVANVCNSTAGVDVGCADMLSDTTTGMIVPSTISGIPCPGTNCTVKILYDQAGTNCGAAACDVTNGVVANRFTLLASCIGSSSLPCMSLCTSVCTMSNSTGFGAVSQPFTISAVFNRTTNNTAYEDYFTDSASNGFLGNNSASSILLYNGGGLLGIATASDNAFHAGQMVFNDAVQSLALIDGVNTNFSMASTAGWATGTIIFGAGARSGVTFRMTELGFWPSLVSSGNRSSLNSNQHGLSGWNF